MEEVIPKQQQRKPAEMTNEPNAASNTKRLVIEQILESIPKHLRRNAFQLIQLLKNYVNVSEDSAKVQYGNGVRGSPFVELLTWFLTDSDSDESPKTRPWDIVPFRMVLKEAGVPEHLLGRGRMISRSEKRITNNNNKNSKLIKRTIDWVNLV